MGYRQVCTAMITVIAQGVAFLAALLCEVVLLILHTIRLATLLISYAVARTVLLLV